jgi:hypothetical protein
VQDEWQDEGPINTRHIREAYRRLKNEKKYPYTKGNVNSFLFKR